MPKRIPYGGKAPKRKTVASSRERRKNKISTQAEEIYKDIFEPLNESKKRNSNASTNDQYYTLKDAEILLKTGALYDMMDMLGYRSTQLEEYLEEESDLVDIALNEARKRERFDKITENKMRKWASMTEEQKEREAEKAREELNDWRNNLKYKW